MKTMEELRAFCEGYHKALYPVEVYDCDDWVVWGGYDINFCGARYSAHAKCDTDLRVDVYKAGWTATIGDPINSFTLTTQGESK